MLCASNLSLMLCNFSTTVVRFIYQASYFLDVFSWFIEFNVLWYVLQKLLSFGLKTWRHLFYANSLCSPIDWHMRVACILFVLNPNLYFPVLSTYARTFICLESNSKTSLLRVHVLWSNQSILWPSTYCIYAPHAYPF